MVGLIKINYMLYEIPKQNQLYPSNLEMTTVGISILTAAQKVLGRLPSYVSFEFSLLKTMKGISLACLMSWSDFYNSK